MNNIYTCEWGATMQLVDFYRVIKETPKTITLREIKKIEVGDGFLTGTCTPVLEDYFDHDKQPIDIIGYKKDYGIISRKSGYTKFFEPWDGKPVRFNHCD